MRFGDVSERKEGATIFVTDFGEVIAGPLVLSRLKALEVDAARPRTKAGRAAKSELRKIEAAICTMSDIYWAAGKEYKKTP